MCLPNRFAKELIRGGPGFEQPVIYRGQNEGRLKIERLTHDVKQPQKQLLHLVFGGELTELDEVEFSDLEKLDIVGIFPNHKTAYDAWKAAAQRTVDNAQMRYFIVHIHRLLDPADDSEHEV